MAIDQGARNTHGGAAVRNGGILKKGPWTTAEDAILMEYVKRHGEGNWNAVQRNSGLMRCGKSCRLRWANHLRPNLKKGAFSPEEELQIIDLHAKLGNKWARMALHLHGRTDNEIKNYWNTRLKRRQRAGLPIYPPLEIQQNQNPNSSSSFNQSPNYYRSHPTVFNSFTFTSPNATYPSHDNSHLKLIRDTNCVALSLSSSSNQPFSTSSSMSPVPRPYYNQALPHTNFNMNALPTTTMGASFNGFSFSQNELTSIQSPFEAITQTSSTNTSQSDYVIPTSSEADNYEIAPELYSRGNSGLLGDVLGGSQALLSSEKEKGKDIQGWEQMEDPDEVDVESIFKAAESNTTGENNLEDSSTGQSSLEIGPDLNAIDDFEEMNFLMTDDLSSLLDDLPLPNQPFPVDNCYVAANDDASTGKSSDNYNNVTSGNVGTTMDNPREVSCSPVAVMTANPAVVAEASNHELNQGTCCWNNMPGFC